MSDTGKQDISALMDDALSAEESRFLLRRLQHEADLVQAWSRYHLVRDCMQGQPAVLTSSSLADRVMQRLQQESRDPSVRRDGDDHRWLRLGAGGVIAAGVAVAALMFTQPPIAQNPVPVAAMPASDVTDTAVAEVADPTQAVPVQDFSLLLDQTQSPWLYVQPAAATRQQQLGYLSESGLYARQPPWLHYDPMRQIGTSNTLPRAPIYVLRSIGQATHQQLQPADN